MTPHGKDRLPTCCLTSRPCSALYIWRKRDMAHSSSVLQPKSRSGQDLPRATDAMSSLGSDM